ncbi:MAG: prepilin-type N-terminal cleavage/methylation domain-containing protein [Planctomycetes bacterium]|nr:prepilin-type N-terminal cleavage/methylation domain-containing protein [Planctomycetota bacterium]
MRAHPASGFTILEVLVAMAILLFGMTAILGLLTYGTALSRTAELRTAAASAAEAVIADLEESFFPEEAGEAGEPRQILNRAVAGVPGLVYSARGRANPERADEYRVDVAMTWSAQGVQREKSFTTLLYREIPFGERLRRRASPGVGAGVRGLDPRAAGPGARTTDTMAPAAAGAAPAEKPR